jgi:hypothetical protein
MVFISAGICQSSGWALVAGYASGEQPGVAAACV